MQAVQAYVEALEALVRTGDTDAAMALFGLDASVLLLEGETSVREALDYAHLMFELGMAEVARDVVQAVLGATSPVRSSDGARQAVA